MAERAIDDRLSEEGLYAALPSDCRTFVRYFVKQVTSSTNDDAKALAAAGAPAFTCVVADQQTAGRGTRGRPFYSPSGTSISLSVILRPSGSIEQATMLTAVSAVAVCRALEDVCGRRASIKWVNDVYVDGGKVCGILTETTMQPGSARCAYAVTGIGVNVYEPEGGYPPELSGRAKAVYTERQPELRNRIASAIVAHLARIVHADDLAAFVPEYRLRSHLIGKSVVVHGGAHDGQSVEVVGVDDRLALLVRTTEGEIVALQSGEVSLHVD